MPSWILPSDTHVVSDTGHTTDHNHIVDDLTLINNSVPVVSGGLTGATQATRYVGATTSGAPASGTFAVGDFAIDQSGKIWVCTTAGSPGTWTQIGTGTVTSVTAGDTSIVVGGTGAAPTIATGTLDVIATNHAPAADWSNNSHKITSLAAGTVSTDAVNISQIAVFQRMMFV